ncbi:hypothetical protein CQ010_04025 [Arthrobacter sp. MYb211]|uniref:hypothetical protein n=1 Tax=Micrococcaceae TaxID=1268 RepID=UPI000CFBDC88|nr:MULTISPECIES: hypothetical protein [unclassified Arthrobacter]PRA01249.1 hypothetical protein CQ017_01740 [Arthrobacter sp. MYb224]PRA13727.1 hypothetical protein CQ015_00020 [Arthrobacter sp. MYb221]PRC09095.1 hypothetical protein CQ010_04025 [Arthrobacter sp. MYb211]
MRKVAVGVSTIAIGLALVGCAAAEQLEPVESSASSAAPVAAENPNVGSIADYKSVALPLASNIEETLDAFDEYHCFNLPDPHEETLCMATIFSAGMKAKTVTASLEGAKKPGVPAYIGDLPDELDTVMSKTLDASEEAEIAADSWDEANCPGATECHKIGLDISMAFDDLHDRLVSWGNY